MMLTCLSCSGRSLPESKIFFVITLTEEEQMFLTRETKIQILKHNCLVEEVQNGKKGFCEGFEND